MTHVDVVELRSGRCFADEVQHGAQVAHVDAALVKSLRQRGTVHREGIVIQAVFHLNSVRDGVKNRSAHITIGYMNLPQTHTEQTTARGRFLSQH